MSKFKIIMLLDFIVIMAIIIVIAVISKSVFIVSGVAFLLYLMGIFVGTKIAMLKARFGG